MQTMDDVVARTKRILTKHGFLDPSILIETSTGMTVRPLPDAPEAIKLSLLEVLGYSLATESPCALQQLWLIAEGWASRVSLNETGKPKNGSELRRPTVMPKDDPNRIETVMICRYDVPTHQTAMTLYEQVRDQAGSLSELKTLFLPDAKSYAESAPLAAIAKGFARGRTTSRSGDQN